MRLDSDLRSVRCSCLFPTVSPHRVIFAVLCLLGWLTAAFHEDFEFAGWLHHHVHHCDSEVAHDSGPAHGDHSAGPDDHLPVWARVLGGISQSIGSLVALLALAVVAWWAVTIAPWFSSRGLTSRWRVFHPPRVIAWCELVRRASPATAPPALA